ncbi:MAG: hypothetical protein AAF266_05530 [Planctomycetota bacterium]
MELEVGGLQAELSDEHWLLIDGLFANPKRTKLMVLADGRGLSLAIDIEAANHAEVKLSEPLPESAMTTSTFPPG